RDQVVALRFRYVEDPPGARHLRSEPSLEHARDHCPESGRRTDHQEGSVRFEDAAAISQRSAAKVEDDVVDLRPPGEVLLRVIDDFIGADRTHQLDVPRTGDGRDARSERLRDLHGERAYAAARAVDQDLLPWLNVGLVAQSLERGKARDRDGCGLLEGKAVGLLRA